jgi:hypothetical protein
MFHANLSPAYGRDFKSALAVRIALAEGKDFILNEPGNRYDGKPVNLPQLRETGRTVVYVRYAANRRVARIDISKNLE